MRRPIYWDVVFTIIGIACGAVLVAEFVISMARRWA